MRPGRGARRAPTTSCNGTAAVGDGTLFTRADEVQEQWLLVDAIVGAWQRDRPGFPNYAAGTWGPPSADDLLHRDGRSWRRH